MLREDKASIAKATSFASFMIEDILRDEWKFVGRKIGLNNKKFIKDFKSKIIKAFGEDGKKLLKYSYNEFIEAIRGIYVEINERYER